MQIFKALPVRSAFTEEHAFSAKKRQRGKNAGSYNRSRRNKDGKRKKL